MSTNDAGMIHPFVRCDRGNIAVITGFLMTALAGFVALGVDVGIWYSRHQVMQRAADSAAIAGAMELARGNDVARIEAAVLQEAAANGVDGSLVDYTIGLNQVTVDIAEDFSLFFARMVTKISPTASVTATAGMNPVQVCIMALAKSGVGVKLQGAAEIVAPGCNIQVDSDSSDAIDSQGGHAAITAHSICVAGATKGSGAFSPTPDEYCTTGVPDPLKDLPEPPEAKGACSQSPVVSGTAQPGVYCGGLNVVGDTVMQPGIYVVRLGNFTVGPSKLTGEGVTIYLQGNATIQMHGNADVELSAPTSGPLAGVVIVSDRDPATLLGLTIGLPHLLTGNSSKSYLGAIYLPKGDITFQGAAGSGSPSPFSIFIAHRIALVGAAEMTIDNKYDATPVPLPGTMSLELAARLIK
ncbi:Flp pilus assembly protein TadG [Constrictibacter sp. MBR-5]|uniref:pilus assembly protein TadG-related protein n=1 Tax=Constrictibacter sp. MBR-5 TaxID=3156467 RepID=UPI00339A1D68